VSYQAPRGEPRRLCPVLPRPEARRTHGRVYLLVAATVYLGLAVYLLTESQRLLHAAELAAKSLWPGSDMCAPARFLCAHQCLEYCVNCKGGSSARVCFSAPACMAW